MKLKYTLSRIAEGKVDSDTLKTCDDGAKAMRDVLVRIAWVSFKPLVPIMWLLTRFYTRKITDTAIEYDFYLIKS